MNKFSTTLRCLILAGVVHPISCFGKPSDPAPELRKMELELGDVDRRLKALETDSNQNWINERETLKEDGEHLWATQREEREKAWNLFVQYLFTLFGVVAASSAGLGWWIKFQKNETEKRLQKIPLMDPNIREFIDKAYEEWGDVCRNLRELELRTKLTQVRHEIVVESIRELKNKIESIIADPNGVLKKKMTDLITKYSEELIIALHLASGKKRYVLLAVNLLEDGDHISPSTINILPRLFEIYGSLDGDAAGMIQNLQSKLKEREIGTL